MTRASSGAETRSTSSRRSRCRARSPSPENRQHAERMAVARNLVNLKSVDKGYGSRSVLRDVTLGVSAGDRIGVVGRNGDGKSTLLALIAGSEEADAGTVTRTGGVTQAGLGPSGELDPAHTSPRGPGGGRARP